MKTTDASGKELKSFAINDFLRSHMLQCRSNGQRSTSLAVEEARVKWVAATKAVSKSRVELSRLGGHANLTARIPYELRSQEFHSAAQAHTAIEQMQSEYRLQAERDKTEQLLQANKDDAERLFHEYNDLWRQETEQGILGFQKSQQRVAWASFAVASVAGVATILNYIF